MPSSKMEQERAARSVVRSSAGALRLLMLQGKVLPPCPYPGHRGSDWRREGDGYPLTCGVCHPPAPGVPVVNVT